MFVAVQRVLITGAAGAIGSVLREGLRGATPILRLMDSRPLEAGPGEEVVAGDVRSLDDARRAVAGCQAVVHLAGLPGDEPYDRVFDLNVTGTQRMLEAARLEGCRRFVFASSNHATGFYPVGERVGPAMPVRPDSFYGAGKVAGEALCRYYHDRHGLEVVCLRIGTFADRPTRSRHLRTWLSHRDCAQLVRCCLEAAGLGFLIVYGVSANRDRWWTEDGWAQLGYRPVDDAGHFADHVPGRAPFRYQGGEFAEPEVAPDAEA